MRSPLLPRSPAVWPAVLVCVASLALHGPAAAGPGTRGGAGDVVVALTLESGEAPLRFPCWLREAAPSGDDPAEGVLAEARSGGPWREGRFDGTRWRFDRIPAGTYELSVGLPAEVRRFDNPGRRGADWVDDGTWVLHREAEVLVGDGALQLAVHASLADIRRITLAPTLRSARVDVPSAAVAVRPASKGAGAARPLGWERDGDGRLVLWVRGPGALDVLVDGVAADGAGAVSGAAFVDAGAAGVVDVPLAAGAAWALRARSEAVAAAQGFALLALARPPADRADRWECLTDRPPVRALYANFDAQGVASFELPAGVHAVELAGARIDLLLVRADADALARFGELWPAPALPRDVAESVQADSEVSVACVRDLEGLADPSARASRWSYTLPSRSLGALVLPLGAASVAEAARRLSGS